MFSDSTLPPSLIQAYRETYYKAFARPDLAEVAFTLLIDQPCAGLLAAHRSHRAGCSAFITACNPYSKHLTDSENARRQDSLALVLKTRGLFFDAGVGQHPSNNWEGEPSFLVYGVDLEAAKALGRQFEQNAIVWAGADAVPSLVMLR